MRSRRRGISVARESGSIVTGKRSAARKSAERVCALMTPSFSRGLSHEKAVDKNFRSRYFMYQHESARIEASEKGAEAVAAGVSRLAANDTKHSRSVGEG